MDAYLASIKDSNLSRKIKLPFGEQSLEWILNNVIVGHVHEFTGEISCLKGLQGLKGYPM